MLNLNAIYNTVMQEVPYQYALIQNLLSKEDSLELAASFPREQFQLSAGEGYGYLWSQMFANHHDISAMPKFGDRWLERIADGTLTSDLSSLNSIWCQLIEELWQPAYREALTVMSGLQLQDCAMVIGFRRYNIGHLHRPHTDEASKALTHMLYFNEYWPQDWGGCLRILKDAQPESVFQDIPPLSDTSVALVRSQNSWHMVTPVASSAQKSRLALRVTFFHQANQSV